VLTQGPVPTTGFLTWLPRNAELREYIASGVSKEDFLRRLRQALQPPPAPALASSRNQAEQGVAPAPASLPAAAVPAAPAADTESASSTSSGRATPTSAAANEAQIQSLLAERAARLAAQKKKDEEEAKKRRLEKSKAKAESIAAGKAPDAQSKHAEALKKKQRVAREERERVLKAIEDDKAARKARQAEKEALRRAAEAAAEVEAKGLPFAPASQLYPSTGRIHEKCALQVRLLDGSTIRSRFSSRDTLKDVRQWVDDNAQLGKTPYTFKILMTPLPSVKLDVTEEGKQLQELGLTPSATLILLPVMRRFAKAYDDAPPPGNIFMRFLAYAVAYISGFFGVILSFIGTLFSTAGPPAPLVDNPSSQGPASGRDGGQASGARQRRNEQQFYNGNSVGHFP
jgi:hypothetical protein